MLCLGSLHKVIYCVYFDILLYRVPTAHLHCHQFIKQGIQLCVFLEFPVQCYETEYGAFLSSKATVVYIRCNKVK